MNFSFQFQFIDEFYNQLMAPYVRNIYAQADARHVLQEVGEIEENYPKFDEQLTEKATHAAYSLIMCGCSYIENNIDIKKGLAILEDAGKLLSDAYKNNKPEEYSRDHNLLISGMALYAARQYSRAFIVLKNITNDFTVGQIISCFIKKDFHHLIIAINSAVFEEHPMLDVSGFDEWTITFNIAKCFSVLLEYISNGNIQNISTINEILDKLLVISKSSNLPLYWLIIRLLKIILVSYKESSLWSILSPLLPSTRVLATYINLLSSFRSPVIELWPSQVDTLPLALDDNDGVVVNLRTSGGKTRVAEIAILKTLIGNPFSKILYLAPFRSLAFEIEQSLHDVFNPLGFTVSHLYGGATVNVSDTELIALSNIIVATPEKAKALIRCDSGITNNIKLIVVDEGHLLGATERNVRNELFLTHIKEYASRNNIRILLLSAVLPNVTELAQWIGGNPSLVAKSNWKPSTERFGHLLWNGTNVRLQWEGEIKSFNPSFVQQTPLGFGTRKSLFPKNKNEAIAATAVRLANAGPVMIFSARAKSIPNLAEAVLLSLGEYPPDYPWPQREWNTFKNICKEELEEDSYILKSAQKGVICHSNRLPALVRISIERLMRSYPPKVIIASSTLGQGVNIGISTVIVATPYIDQNAISKRDFWNICGRAGRAFSDAEGKILYAIDHTKKTWQITKDYNLARDYFDKSQLENVESGLLVILNYFLRVSRRVNVEFGTFIEMIANDNIIFENDNGISSQVETLFNIFDDELLAMHEDLSLNDNDTLEWVEIVFKKSLAVIQAQANSNELIQILEARTKALLKRIPSKVKRKTLVSSGLPLLISNSIYDNLDSFKVIANEYFNDQTMRGLDKAIRFIEVWSSPYIRDIVENPPAQDVLDNIRLSWLNGTSLIDISLFESNADYVTSQYYGYALPWIINSIAQMFDKETESQYSEFFSRLALLVELGLPNETAAFLYLSGIRSRKSSIELAEQEEFNGKNNYSTIKSALSSLDRTMLSISAQTRAWLDLLSAEKENESFKKIKFPSFTWNKKGLGTTLTIREINGDVYLCSYDFTIREKVEHTNELPFRNIANIFGLYLNLENGTWFLKSNLPNIRTT